MFKMSHKNKTYWYDRLKTGLTLICENDHKIKEIEVVDIVSLPLPDFNKDRRGLCSQGTSWKGITVNYNI